MIVVDSSVWISAFRGIENPATLALQKASRERRLIVGDIVLLEVLQGAESEKQAALLEQQLRRFMICTMMDSDLAIAAARNYRLLRSKGITIRKTPDLIISTFCIENDHHLLHQDRDFGPMREHLGLKVVV